MAKKTKRNSSNKRRVALANANRRLPFETMSPRSMSSIALSSDRRFFHPQGLLSPAYALSRSSRILEVPRAKPRPNRFRKLSVSPHIAAFHAPERVLVCVRRSIRKEVIHALGHSGRSGQRPPRRSEFSSISCK